MAEPTPNFTPPAAAPGEPAFWETRYRAGRTPWDAGGVPAPLARWLAAHPGHGARGLIPGCGSGHEIGAFARAGYDVTAIDFSPAAVARARALNGPALAPRIIEADFFHHDFGGNPFDLVYERTFLCALPPARWPEIVARLAGLLRRGGMMAGFYYFGEKAGGPPFGLAAGELEKLFAPGFAPAADVAIPAHESLPLFAGCERWREWRRT